MIYDVNLKLFDCNQVKFAKGKNQNLPTHLVYCLKQHMRGEIEIVMRQHGMSFTYEWEREREREKEFSK